MNLNKAFLIGRLTRDPESRTLPSGRPVVSFGLATNRIWTDRDSSERREQTDFHNIVVFGRLAEICNQYLSKGKLVLIEGRIQTRSWQAQDGTKRYRTEIIAENMQMGPRFGPGAGSPDEMPPTPPKEEVPKEEIPVIDLDESEKSEESGESEESEKSDESDESEPQNPIATQSKNSEQISNDISITESEDKGEVDVRNIPF